MATESRVLVVGTTPDYIDWIRNSSPESALFLTEERLRRTSSDPAPEPGEEVLCSLEDTNTARWLVREHLRRWRMKLSGIVCYDCESLPAAADLASEFELPFPPAEAINNCRSKYDSKVLWKKYGVSCPDYRMISSAEEAWAFIEENNGPGVLKPVYGSGSELTFHCRSREDCRRAVDHFYDRHQHTAPVNGLNGPEKPLMLAESWISGKEYSCDFLIEDGRAEVLRFTAKISAPSAPFGTTLGYAIVPPPPDTVAFCLRDELLKAAGALGIKRAICMTDFMIGDSGICFLEMTPRLGGDCLPHLVRSVYGVDMLALAMDFARGRGISQTPPGSSRGIGLRIFAEKGGVLRNVATSSLENDPRILDLKVTRKAGHKITLPPHDYDSWLLGYVIFIPDEDGDRERQCFAIRESIQTEIS